MDATIKQMLEKTPLVAFSLHSQLNLQALEHVRREIESSLESAIDGQAVDGPKLILAHSLFWLWVLGAFELFRIIVNSPECFSNESLADAKSTKAKLVRLRNAFAKQEVSGKHALVTSDGLVDRLSVETKDVGIVIGDNNVWMRSFLQDIHLFFSKLTFEDIKKPLESRYHEVVQ